MLGGGWRQAGVLAAAGLYALDHMVDRCGHMMSRPREFLVECASRFGLVSIDS